MENEKKFSNEMFGYDKREVEEYIKAMKAEYESKIQAEKSDANRIANELTILKRKLEKYETDYIAKQEKVANALITAEDQAKKIIENSEGIIAKVGAGGLCIVVNTKTEEAFVVKICDCDMKARELVVIQILKNLHWAEIEADKDIKTISGKVVGEIKVLPFS